MYKDKEKAMTVNGLSMTLNMPDAVESRTVNGKEVTNALPPYKEMPRYVVDEYPACPDNWIHGSDKAGSFFVPVRAGSGLWFDFNDCQKHEHEVAVVISVQGINPITGQKQDKLRLEQYRDKCPVHDVSFEQDRFCPKCEFKWPAQNYLSTTGTPNGCFWLDGFRSSDGNVRQYVLTKERLKGVAQQLIGKDTVYAIGVAFFLSKEPKPKPETSHFRHFVDPSLVKIGAWQTKKNITYSSDSIKVKETKLKDFMIGSNTLDGSDDPLDCTLTRGAISSSSASRTVQVKKPVKVEKLEVGAGSLIDQQVYKDPNDLDYWREEPEAFIYINYASQEDVDKILSKGKRKEKSDGFLANVDKVKT